MKVDVYTLSEEAIEKNYGDAIEIKVNGTVEFSVSDGEPEDNNLNRNFSDCHTIEDLMQQAYNAGKAGEDFDVVYHVVEEI